MKRIPPEIRRQMKPAGRIALEGGKYVLRTYGEVSTLVTPCAKRQPRSVKSKAWRCTDYRHRGWAGEWDVA